MTVKSTIAAQLRAAHTVRDAADSETITFGGTPRTGTFEAFEADFDPQPAGHRQREQLRGFLRLDQFLDDPTTFTPETDMRAQLPNRSVQPTLRGRTWSITDTTTDYDHWIITLEERKPRP